MASVQDGAFRVIEGRPIAEPFVLPASEAAQYVEQMCGELMELADNAGLGFLAYLIEVAREEAMLHAETGQRSIRHMHGELPPR